MAKPLRCFVVLAFFLSLPFVYRHFSQGFRPEKLYRASLEKPLFDPTAIKDFLRQDFIYVGQGTQCYVFEGADHQTMLKLFRFEQPMNPLYQWIRTSFKKKPFRKSFEAQREQMISACHIAALYAPQETGILAIHLTNTCPLWCHLRGPLLQNWNLDLGQLCFALQKKAIPFSICRDSQKLASFRKIIIQRALKGIVNRDPNVERNFGVVEDGVIELDFGSYALASKEEAEINATQFIQRMETWLNDHPL